MNSSKRMVTFWSSTLSTLLFFFGLAEIRADQTLTVRSGNAAIGSQDPKVHVLSYGHAGDVTPSSADFTNAQTAPFAPVIAADPAWISQLPSDPTARWVAATSLRTPVSALYAISFQLTDPSIDTATVDLFFSVDNAINGVFINGSRISGNSYGGDYHSEFRFIRKDISSLLRTNGTNWLYLNLSDYGAVAGLIFSATITTHASPVTGSVLPNHGGNAGAVTVRITGNGFKSGAVVTLTGLGPDVLGTNTTIQNDTDLLTTLPLTNIQPGLRTVTVTNTDNTSFVIPDGFTVENGGVPELWVDIVGPDTFRAGREQTFYVLYGNRGNVDVYDNRLFVTLPKSTSVSVDNLLPSDPPVTPNILLGSANVLPLWIYALPADSTGYVTLQVTVPPGTSTAGTLSASLTRSPSSPFTRTGDFSFVPATATLLAKSIVTTLHGPNPATASAARLQHRLARVPFLTAAADTCPDELLYTDAQEWQNCVNTYQNSILTHLRRINGINSPRSYAQGTSLNILGNLQPPIGAGFSIFGAILTFFQLRSLEEIADSVFASRVYHPVTSVDPNAKFGTLGAGDLMYVPSGVPLSYDITFENKPTASAPAQDVFISDTLDASTFNLGTVRLGPISFGSHHIVPPAGVLTYTTSVDLRPAKSLIVKVNADLDATTGVLNWRFHTVDAVTGLPPTDPLAGFLAPGESGTVLFSVRARTTLATGTPLQNGASIMFDVNPPILTPIWVNVIDSTRPTSSLSTLGSIQTSPTFTLQWAGMDIGSGIKDYTIYASDNGGAFTPVLVNRTGTQGTFTGAAGHTYGFYSIARDRTGNIELPKTVAEATTVVKDTTPPRLKVTLLPSVLWPPNHKLQDVTATLQLSDDFDSTPKLVLLSISSDEPDSGLGDADLPNDIQGASLGTDDRSFSLRAERSDSGTGRTYTVRYRATDASGNSTVATAIVTVPHDQQKK
jgi:hypothetical protein